MNRQRVLLLEDDRPMQSVLRELFGDEGLDVTLCESLAELQAGVKQYPRAVVVSDSWAPGDYQHLSAQQRTEIVALAKTTQVVLTTGRHWAKYSSNSELGTTAIIAKPYNVDNLMGAIRAGLDARRVG